MRHPEPDQSFAAVTFDGMNFDLVEDLLDHDPAKVRLTVDGPQVKLLVGADSAVGWSPLHEHHTVLVVPGEDLPLLLSPATARAFGFRDDAATDND